MVTGAGSGIGEAIARAAHGAGARHVVVADLNGMEARRVAGAIGGTAVELDVRDESAIVAMVEATLDAHGPIDLFVSNAGFVTAAGLEDSNEAIQTMWEVHCMAHIYAARAVLPSMIARGEGYILSTASAAGLLTQIGSMAYSMTKAAAISLAEWLAISHHHQGIRVSVLCPQAVATNIVCLEAIRDERFLVLPHPEVATYVERKAADRDRWLAGMRRFQSALHPDGVLPGDAMTSGVRPAM